MRHTEKHGRDGAIEKEFFKTGQQERPHLSRDELGAAEVLELYRARWQIESCFNRFKSLLRLGHLPKRNDASARAWIQGKLLTVLLIEHMAREAGFSRGDSASTRRSRWLEFIEARDAVMSVLARPLQPSELIRHGPALGPRLANPPRTSPPMWAEAATGVIP